VAEQIVLFDDFFDLFVSGEISRVNGDSIISRVCVIHDKLIEIVSDVIILWVPHTILKVDEGDVCRISKRGQNIVLLAIIVGENNIISRHYIP